MQKWYIVLGAGFGALGVFLGAFGAHAFKSILEANGRIATFETAVKYHFVHALALIITGLLLDRYSHRFLHLSGYMFISGILLFSGSLYVLSLTGNTRWGAVAPVGGLAMALGWILMAVGTARSATS